MRSSYSVLEKAGIHGHIPEKGESRLLLSTVEVPDGALRSRGGDFGHLSLCVQRLLYCASYGDLSHILENQEPERLDFDV